MTGSTLKPYVESAAIVVVYDQDPDTSWLEQTPAELGSMEAAVAFRRRLKAYQAGKFHFVGVYAEARVRFETPQGGWTQGSYVRTPGLWGIESDSDESYFAEVGEDEQYELNEMLEALNVGRITESLPIKYR